MSVESSLKRTCLSFYPKSTVLSQAKSYRAAQVLRIPVLWDGRLFTKYLQIDLLGLDSPDLWGWHPVMQLTLSNVKYPLQSTQTLGVSANTGKESSSTILPTTHKLHWLIISKSSTWNEHGEKSFEFGQGLKQQKFFWGCQATLIIHNVNNSTYELGIQHVLSFTNRVIQEATKINMTEGTDKAGPVTRHNKGFDLLQTPLPHFCPAKLPNLFSALQKWSLKARNVIPKTLRCQQVHVTKGYVTLGLTPERRKEKPQSVQHLPSTQRTPNYCHVTGISLIGLASSQNSKWFSSHLGMHFQQRTTTSPHPPNFQWNVL